MGQCIVLEREVWRSARLCCLCGVDLLRPHDPRHLPSAHDASGCRASVQSSGLSDRSGALHRPCAVHLHHAADLHKKGITHLHVVVGSDRKKEMHELLHKYNNKESGHGHYNFKKITVHSAGSRDPDAEGTSGVSGTKQREHASKGHYDKFRKGVPAHLSDKHAKELMHDVHHGMK